MYKVYADGKPLSPCWSEDKIHYVYSPKITLELNTINSFSFQIEKDHPLYDQLEHRTTIIQVYDDTEELFRGRIAETKIDIYNTATVYAESELSFLKDSFYRPFGFSGGVSEFFTMLIENHNAQVDETRQFVIGEVTVTDPNDYIVRSSNVAADTWTLIKEKLIDLLGGYIRIRVAHETRYIDYIEDYGEFTGQTVEFKKNLLKINKKQVSTDVITCLIPYGAQFNKGEDGYEEEPESGAWNGNRVTIESVNNGLDYIENETGIAVYGRVWGTNVWDDVTLPTNLLTKAETWLEEKIASTVSIETKVLDLHLLNADIPRLKLGYLVKAYSAPHNISTKLRITKQVIPLDKPGQDEVTLGAVFKTLTDIV